MGFPKATARFSVSLGLTELRELLYSQFIIVQEFRLKLAEENVYRAEEFRGN